MVALTSGRGVHRWLNAVNARTNGALQIKHTRRRGKKRTAHSREKINEKAHYVRSREIEREIRTADKISASSFRVSVTLPPFRSFPPASLYLVLFSSVHLRVALPPPFASACCFYLLLKWHPAHGLRDRESH